MSEVESAALRAVIADMAESVSVYGLDGSILFMNPTTERVLGVKLDEVRGRRLFELFPAGLGTRFHEAFVRVAAGGAPESFEHYYEPFDAWFANHVSRSGDHVRVIARDVTEDARRRRRLETQARISEVLTDEGLDLFTATRAIAERLTATLDADCSIALLSPDRVWLDLVAVCSREGGARQILGSVTRFPADQGHPGEALRTRCAVLANEAGLAETTRQVQGADTREAIGREGSASLLVAPLLAGEDAIGVLMAVRREGSRALTEDDRVLAGAIAPSVGLFVAHARGRAEAASLRHRLFALTDAIPALVSFVDRELRYQYVNVGYEQWFGRPRETVIGRPMREVVGEAAFAIIEPHAVKALQGEQQRYRSHVAYETGAREVDAQYLPIRDASGEIEGFAVLVQDVTAEARILDLERRERDAERRSARRLESLLALAGKLAAASRRDEIARVVVDEGMLALEAASSAMYFVEATDVVLARERGLVPEHREAFARMPIDAAGPVSEAIAGGRPVWIASRAEYAERYPELEPLQRPSPPPPLAFAVLPLADEGRTVGCVSFVFHDEHRLTPADRAYLEVLASHVAEALRRARLYAELRDVSETREAMIRSSPAAIMLLDGDGVVHAWNPAAERIFGVPASEAIGSFAPANEDRREEFLQNVRRVLGGEIIEAREARRRRIDGEWFDAEIHGAPVTLSDGRVMCLAIIADVTQRKRVERGRHLIARVSAALVRTLDVSETLARVVRLPVEDFTDFCCVDLLRDGALDRVAMSREDAEPGVPIPRRRAHDPERGGSSRAIATRRPQLIVDVDEEDLLRLARDDAHLSALRAMRNRSFLSVPLLVAGDRAVGSMTFGSRTRNFDDVDVAIASELASHVVAALENTRLFREASDARREAEAASRAKDEFLAMLGHELRNPLAPLVTALELMRIREPDRLVREREVIGRQVTHLSRLVDDLLDVSRITRGKVELRREVLSLAGVVNKAIEMTSPLLETKKHKLTVDVSESLVVHGDPTRLAQVVANLLSNAAKYTPAQGNIHVRAAGAGDEITLSIRDDGVGIPTDMLPRIFDVFVQAPQSRARSDGGLGLGLAIVKSLVAAHGGRIEARSDGPGRGTELTITLPADHAPAAPSRSTPPSTVPSRTRKILVVDDNDDAALTLAESLGIHGHETRTAHDGPSALEAAASFAPDVVILDIGLPVMDGYELAERLRAKGSFRPLRLIAVTGYGQESDRDRAHRAGFDAHLAKPVTIDTLLQVVDG